MTFINIILKRRVILLSAAFACLISYILSMPIETPVSEPQNVLVLSSKGQPIVGAAILQNWFDYNAELGSEHVAIEVTDENGRVSFPARVTRRSAFYRTFVPILGRLYYGVHSGKGVAMHMRIENRGKIGTNKVNKKADDYVIIQGDSEDFGKIYPNNQ